MIQYKLIQEYPGSPKLGTIDWYKTDEFGPSSNSIWQGTNFYDAHPKYWQKVEEVDYEIISLKLTGGEIITFKNGKCIHRTDDQSVDYTFNLDKCMSNLSSTEYIHSVKRLSDGEVFTIGDNINYDHYSNFNKITKISINQKGSIKEGVWVNYAGGSCHLSIAKKLPKKTPLFTTEDGKEIFEGDKYYVVYADFSLFGYNAIENKIAAGNKFSSCKKAEKFKLLNYPVLCLNDLLSVWGNAEYPEKSPLFKKFEELAKSKL